MKITGWLTPNGKFFECDTYMHLDVVSSEPELLRYVPNHAELMEKVQGAKDVCEDLAANGEHPEWHIYDMAADSARFEIQDLLKAGGCLRVGTWGIDLYFSGKVTATIKQAAEDLAAGYDMGVVFEI